jgi:hypothetical protein
MGGDDRPSGPFRPFITSGVRRLTAPFSPNPAIGRPVRALIARNMPSGVPNKI